MDINVEDILIGNPCNWQVECLLARGTCSQVFQAKYVGNVQHKDCALVAAIKVFREGKNYESAAWNEVHIHSHLTKNAETMPDCIVPLMDHFYHNKHVCLVYEKLSYDLHHILLRNSSKGLPLAILQKCSKQLFRTFQHLASMDVVHGDIKLSNIMWNSGRGIFQLVDFGLAFHEGQQSAQPVQSPGYESPEAHMWNKMIKEKDLFERTPNMCCCASDMWSLGCVLVHLYTGLAVSAENQNSHPSTCDQCVQGRDDCHYSAHLDQTLVLPQDSRLITEEQHQAFKDLITSLSELLLLPTRFLLLVNMYGDVNELGDSEDYTDLLSDVEEECTKYGKVRRVFVPLDGSEQCDGKVCVEYEFAESCEKAASALMGRIFNDRTVITSFCLQ